MKNFWVVRIKRTCKFENDFILLLKKHNTKNYTINVYPTTVYMFDVIAEHEGRKTELPIAFFFYDIAYFFLLFLFNLFLFNDLIIKC